MNQMPHPLTLMVIFQLKVPEVAATIAGISRTEDMNPVSDAGNAGLPCVWSLGIPPTPGPSCFERYHTECI